ncbi:MAG: PIN domain-containing protein [Thermofilum sp.]
MSLVETGFLLALNPRDKNRDWALSLLREAKSGRLKLYLSPAAPIELSLILKSRGLAEQEIALVLEAMGLAISRYTRPVYPPLTLEAASLAANLRERYPELTFFDSLHAAVALSNKLEYRDLDEIVRRVVEEES